MFQVIAKCLARVVWQLEQPLPGQEWNQKLPGLTFCTKQTLINITHAEIFELVREQADHVGS